MCKPKGIIVLILFGCMHLAHCQDAPSSQWYSNMVLSNPSLAGNTGKTRLNIFYRNQWPGNEARFLYYGVTFDQSIPKYQIGWGIIASNEQAAFYYKPSLYTLYSYQIKINNEFIVNLGIKAGFIQEFTSLENLNFEEEETISSNSSGIKFDFGSGLSFFGKNTFGGFMFDHLSRPVQGTSINSAKRLNIKFTVNLSHLFYLSSRLRKDEFIIMPNIIIQKQGQQQNLQLGVLSQVNHLIVGLWLRQNWNFDAPAIIFLTGIKTLNTRIAYSFDMYSNRKMQNGNGTHEISITRLFEVKAKKSHKPISCPSFLQ
jgi:type IX secretion system PorP/SprF family membrane protein